MAFAAKKGIVKLQPQKCLELSKFRLNTQIGTLNMGFSVLDFIANKDIRTVMPMISAEICLFLTNFAPFSAKVGGQLTPLLPKALEMLTNKIVAALGTLCSDRDLLF